jgi:hypothetical protein
MNTSLQLGRVGQISRSVRDIQQAETWYGTVLGLKHLFTFGKLAFFDLNGTRLYLSQEGVHKHGDGTEEWMSFFKDPEGRTLALMSQVKR